MLLSIYKKWLYYINYKQRLLMQVKQIQTAVGNEFLVDPGCHPL